MAGRRCAAYLRLELARVACCPPSSFWTAMDALPAHRPRSIRSVASNSSIASGVSLSRRSRTRTRSKTVTGDAPRSPLLSDLPYLGGAVVQEPENILDAPLEAPERPPRSPQRLLADPHSVSTPSSQDVDQTFVELTQSTTSRPVRVLPQRVCWS